MPRVLNKLTNQAEVIAYDLTIENCIAYNLDFDSYVEIPEGNDLYIWDNERNEAVLDTASIIKNAVNTAQIAHSNNHIAYQNQVFQDSVTSFV